MRPLLHFNVTTETCEGTICARCRIIIDHCQCSPHGLTYRSISERISGQGWVPQTEVQEAA
jgi:hypothetical protein